MTNEEWAASVARGARGADIVALNLCGKAFWGSSATQFSIQWDKRTVCRAQNWVDTSKRKELYDFEISCPACNECPYYHECESEKPYNAPVTKERHEVKTNYSTHMKKKDWKGSKGKTQNIYIEIMQNCKKWLETGAEKHLGWYHEKLKAERPKWYHFYQPIVDPEGDGKYSSKPDIATDGEKEAFSLQAQPGDSLVTEFPWGYIISTTAEALERLIQTLDEQGRIEYLTCEEDKSIVKAKLIPVVDIRPNGRDIIYTPVFTEINKEGQVFTKYPVSKRYIPQRMKDKVIDDEPFVVNVSADQAEKLLGDWKNILGIPGGFPMIVQKTYTGPAEMHKRNAIVIDGEIISPGKGGFIWPIIYDLENMEGLKGGCADG